MDTKKETVNYYRKDAGKFYDTKRFYSLKGKYTDALEKKALLSLIGNVKGKKIVELGCGTVRFSSMLSRMGADIISMDHSSEMLRFAKKKMKKGLFVKGDIENLPFKDGYFDVVFSFRVLIHYREKGKALREFSRIVKRNGIVVVDTLNLFRLDFPRTFSERLFKHESVYSDFLSHREIKKRYSIKTMKITDIIGVKVLPPLSPLIKLVGKNKMASLDRKLGKSRFKYFGASCFIKYEKGA